MEGPSISYRLSSPLEKEKKIPAAHRNEKIMKHIFMLFKNKS